MPALFARWVKSGVLNAALGTELGKTLVEQRRPPCQRKSLPLRAGTHIEASSGNVFERFV